MLFNLSTQVYCTLLYICCICIVFQFNGPMVLWYWLVHVFREYLYISKHLSSVSHQSSVMSHQLSIFVPEVKSTVRARGDEAEDGPVDPPSKRKRLGFEWSHQSS